MCGQVSLSLHCRLLFSNAMEERASDIDMMMMMMMMMMDD